MHVPGQVACWDMQGLIPAGWPTGLGTATSAGAGIAAVFTSAASMFLRHAFFPLREFLEVPMGAGWRHLVSALGGQHTIKRLQKNTTRCRHKRCLLWSARQLCCLSTHLGSSGARQTDSVHNEKHKINIAHAHSGFGIGFKAYFQAR